VLGEGGYFYDVGTQRNNSPPTGKQMHTPCCDVFHLKDGKISSFHCYVAVPILLEQLGVFLGLRASFRR
jgi:ketosteroid isomerase-like protein